MEIEEQKKLMTLEEEVSLIQSLLPEESQFFDSISKSMNIKELTIQIIEKISKKGRFILRMAPFMSDFLKIGRNFKFFTELLIEFREVMGNDEKFKKISENLSLLSRRNLLELYLQVIEDENKPSIGLDLIKRNEAIPFTYWRYSYSKKTLRYSIDSPLLYGLEVTGFEKMIINFGFTENIGKTELLSEILGIEESALNYNDSGIMRI